VLLLPCLAFVVTYAYTSATRNGGVRSVVAANKLPSPIGTV
jgi:hypothetical protein